MSPKHYSLGRKLVVLALSVGVMANSSHSLAGSPASITLRVAQSGFAGVTGTQYQLTPDGKWQASTFVDATATGAAGAGELPASHLQQFADQLTMSDFKQATLVANAYEGVNPAIVELQYGEQAITFKLEPGYVLGAPCPFADGPACQLLNIAHQMQQELSTK